MDREKNCGYPFENGFVHMYLTSVQNNIRQGNYAMAKINLGFAKDAGASPLATSEFEEIINTVETEKNLVRAKKYLSNGDLIRARIQFDKAKKSGVLVDRVSELENQINIAEAMKSLKEAQEQFSSGDQFNAKRLLDKAKKSGVLIEGITEFETKMNAVLEAKQFMTDANTYFYKGDTGSATECLGSVNGLLKYLDQNLSESYLRQIDEMGEKIKNLIKAEQYLTMAQETLSKKLYEEAEKYLNKANKHGLKWDIYREMQNRILVEQAVSEAEMYLSKGQLKMAEMRLKRAEIYEKKSDLVRKVQEKINAAEKTKYTHASFDKSQHILETKYNSETSDLGVQTISTPIIAPLLSNYNYEPQRYEKNTEIPMDTMDSNPGPSHYQVTGNHAGDKKSVADNIKDKPLYKQHENDNIMQEINEIPVRPKRIYFDECTRNSASENNNMSHSSLNDAICIDETQYHDETRFDDSSSFEQDNKTKSSSEVMDIDDDFVVIEIPSNDKINVHQPDSKQQALLKPLEKWSTSAGNNDNHNIDKQSSEAKNKSSDVQNTHSGAKSETSKNTLGKPPVPEKTKLKKMLAHKNLSSEAKNKSSDAKNETLQNTMKKPIVPDNTASKMDTENIAKDLNNQNHTQTFGRVPEMGCPNNFEINNQVHSDQKLHSSVPQKLNVNNTETHTAVLENTEPLLEKGDLKTVQMQKEKEDTKPLETKTVHTQQEVDNDNISLPKKCEVLVNEALKDGHVENAERILQIAQKLYPEHDFAFIRFDITEAKSDNNNTNVKEITPKPIEINMKETKNKVSGKDGNYAEYTTVHKEKEIPKVHKSEHGMTTRGRSTEVRKPEYSLRTREKSVVRPNKSDEQNGNSNEYKNKDINNSTNINPNYYKNKENRANNDSANGTANREQADYCLKCAKDAFEANDIEKAERLATKADRMHPSEEAKSILAEILQKKCYVKDREVKSDNTRYSAGHEENKGDAQKSLEIAFTAHAKGDIEKCRRFLRKAQSFDRSIDIDVYLSDLQRKKAQKEHEKIIAERMKRDEEEQQRKAERASRSYKEMIKDYLFGSGKSTDETKTAQENKNKEYCSYKDCVTNNSSPPGAQKTCKNNSPPPEAKKTENEVQRAGTDSKTDQAAAKDNASNERGDEKEPENEGKSQNELKAIELENKAMGCCDGGDYEQALLLLDSAKGLHPNKQKVQDLIGQVQEAIETRKNTTTETNQNEAKEREDDSSKSHTIEMENMNTSSTQNVKQNNSHSSKGTDSYVHNMVHLFDNFQGPKTGHNSQQNVRRYPREFTNSYYSRGRGCKPEKTSNSLNYIPRARSSRSLNRKDNFDFNDALNLRNMAVKAFHAKKYEEAEKWLTESDDLYPNHETRKLINDVRKEKNRKGSM